MLPYKTRIIKCYLINGIKVDFVNYKYPWIDDAICYNSLRLASPKDIATMKINTVGGRVTKKDFVDIYFLLEKYPLTERLAFYELKYPEHSQLRDLNEQVFRDILHVSFVIPCITETIIDANKFSKKYAYS